MDRSTLSARCLYRTFAFLLVGIAFLAPASSQAYSILLNPPDGWNGFYFEGTITAGFREHGGTSDLLTSSSALLLVGPSYETPAPGSVYSNSVSLTNFPGTGLPKDQAGGLLEFSYTVGAADASASDRFDVRFTATTSASNAFVDFGSGLVEADAYFKVNLRMQSAWPLLTDAGATLGLPAMTNPTAPTPNVETLSAIATIGPYGVPATTYTRLPGDPELVIPVTLGDGEFFEYTLEYSLLTPFGTDPTVSYDFNGSAATTVPEPSTLALVCLGLIAVVMQRSHRKD